MIQFIVFPMSISMSYRIKNGTGKRWGDDYPKHYFMKFANAGDFSIEYANFDMDSRGLRLVRPLH